MKRSLSLFFAVIILSIFPSCAAFTKKPKNVPSVSVVKSNVTQASGSVNAANDASKRSSEHIKKFKSRAELIDYKATRALELL